jgi:glutaredoxin
LDGVKIYTKDGCPHCARLRDDLREKGVQFQEFSVSRDKNALREAKEVYGADRVPVLVEGEKVTIGYQGGPG